MGVYLALLKTASLPKTAFADCLRPAMALFRSTLNGVLRVVFGKATPEFQSQQHIFNRRQIDDCNVESHQQLQ